MSNPMFPDLYWCIPIFESMVQNNASHLTHCLAPCQLFSEHTLLQNSFHCNATQLFHLMHEICPHYHCPRQPGSEFGKIPVRTHSHEMWIETLWFSKNKMPHINHSILLSSEQTTFKLSLMVSASISVIELLLYFAFIFLLFDRCSTFNFLRIV